MVEIKNGRNIDCLAIMAFIVLAALCYLNIFAKEKFLGIAEEYEIDKISVQYDLLGEKIRVIEEKLNENKQTNSMTEDEVGVLRQQIGFLQNDLAGEDLMKGELENERYYPLPISGTVLEEEKISDEEWEEIIGKSRI